MKKILPIILTFTLLLSVFSGCTHNNPLAQGTVENTNYISNPASDFEYVVNSDQSGISIHKYIGTSEYVVIPSHIDNYPVLSLRGTPSELYPTEIEQGVFENSNIETVVIPETVKSIGSSAFLGCERLTTVTFLPNSSLIYIVCGAFANCVKLEKIDLSSTQLKAIDSFAFLGCSNLKEITFSNTLEEIRERAFYKCSSLLAVELPESLKKIGGGAFGYCSSLERVVIPSNLNLNAFDEAIFHNVPALKQFFFADGREEIAGYALVQTDASFQIIVPKSVEKFSPLTFLVNPSAQIMITFLGNAPEIVEEDDPDWFGTPTICYYPKTSGWDTFIWKDKFELLIVPGSD